MGATDRELGVEHADAVLHFGGLLVRSGLYAALGSVSGHHDFGQAILTGLLLGDIAASTAGLLWQQREHALQLGAELAIQAAVFLWFRAAIVWPPESALRAIVALAAFGVFASRTGGSLWTRLGPD